jgi:hypothetical protein
VREEEEERREEMEMDWVQSTRVRTARSLTWLATDVGSTLNM